MIKVPALASKTALLNMKENEVPKWEALTDNVEEDLMKTLTSKEIAGKYHNIMKGMV